MHAVRDDIAEVPELKRALMGDDGDILAHGKPGRGQLLARSRGVVSESVHTRVRSL